MERLERGRLLRLRAEMHVPGEAWLELGVEDADADADADGDGRSVLRQRALYHPRGPLGDLYWLAVWPFHGIVFGGMQRNIARAAEAAERERTAGVDPAADDPTAVDPAGGDLAAIGRSDHDPAAPTTAEETS